MKNDTVATIVQFQVHYSPVPSMSGIFNITYHYLHSVNFYALNVHTVSHDVGSFGSSWKLGIIAIAQIHNVWTCLNLNPRKRFQRDAGLIGNCHFSRQEPSFLIFLYVVIFQFVEISRASCLKTANLSWRHESDLLVPRLWAVIQLWAFHSKWSQISWNWRLVKDDQPHPNSTDFKFGVTICSPLQWSQRTRCTVMAWSSTN